MVKRALTEKRPWLFAAIAAAIAYFFLKDNPIGGLWLMLLKGSCVAFLAVYAFQRHHGRDAQLLAMAMALGSVGDMLIEIDFVAGGAAFFCAHLAAMILYLQNRRSTATFGQKSAATALLLITPLLCWLLVRDMGVATYGLALGGMAATAWMSRFSRYRVGLGAVLFVISDLLIFARMGDILAGGLYELLIWPIYFCGQFLIATGVIQTLRKELPDRS